MPLIEKKRTDTRRNNNFVVTIISDATIISGATIISDATNRLIHALTNKDLAWETRQQCRKVQSRSTMYNCVHSTLLVHL